MMRPQFFGVAIVAFGLVLAGCSRNVAVKSPSTPRSDATAATAAPAPYSRSATAEPARPEAASASTNRMPDAATRQKIQDLLDRIQDAYFDYDQKSLRPDAIAALKEDSQALSEIIRQYPDFRLIIEGYCDERGSSEYNLALGEARAKQAEEYLVTLGLPANQLKTVSYGKEKQVCTDATEACWQKNRRAHVTQSS
jgi:peptidoglycan-associated lipoprotein